MKTIEELEEANRRLADELKEARAAQAQAEAASRNKSVFLANMSHEVRTPLSAIIGFSNLLAEAGEESERRVYAEVIETNCSLLLQLINDILDLSKIESGAPDFVEEEFGLNALLVQLTEMARIRLTNPEVELRYVALPAECWVMADKKMLSQVLINLLTNAVKFTERGSVSVGCEMCGGFLRFHVTDTGPGIPPEQTENIFARFVRLDPTKPGTGLGLPICRSIVEHLGGEIGVCSEVGKGATFWFTVPHKFAQ